MLTLLYRNKVSIYINFTTALVHNKQLICFSLHLTFHFLLLEAFTELSPLQVDLGFCKLRWMAATTTTFGHMLT